MRAALQLVTRTLVALLMVIGGTHTLGASSIVILTGSGTSSLNAPLTAAGFTVINGTLAPGQIAANLAADTVGVYVWNDGSLGGTGSAEIPALSFDSTDLAALTAFHVLHSNWIMDGLAWRGNASGDEVGFSQNEAIQLANAGGGIVLGADDASGALIVQHVNQVASWFNFNPWGGVYLTPPGLQQTGGSFFSSPNVVDPTGIVGTTSYSEVPHGMQPNGIFMATAVFGTPISPYPGFDSPDLEPDVFNGTTYQDVNHLVTTNIPGAAINDAVPEPGTLSLLAIALCGLALARRRS